MSKKNHHGGAWKVAYADFTTAMMALFIVLWLTSQDQRIKDAVERAFRNPFTSVTKDSVGLIPNKEFRLRLGYGVNHAAPPERGPLEIAPIGGRR